MLNISNHKSSKIINREGAVAPARTPLVWIRFLLRILAPKLILKRIWTAKLPTRVPVWSSKNQNRYWLSSRLMGIKRTWEAHLVEHRGIGEDKGHLPPQTHQGGWVQTPTFLRCGLLNADLTVCPGPSGPPAHTKG